MYDDYDDFYGDYSEYNDMIYELKEALKKEVKDEIIQEMERLKKENAELADIKANWNAKVQELENKKYEYETAKRQAEDNAKRSRLRTLLKPLVKPAWGYKYEYQDLYPKCDKCDEKGYIHFTSPQGKELTELCNCRRRICVYHPIEAQIVSLQDKSGYDYAVNVMFEYNYNDSDSYDSFKTVSDVYNGQDFSEINEYRGIVFFNKEDCQKYCDYLNQKERDKLKK